MGKTALPRQNELAAITYLVARAQGYGLRLGRTSLMKLLYFVKEIKAVRLQYDFKLKPYGPFDPAVLQDLELAQSLKTIKVRLEYFQNSYAYVFQYGERAGDIQGAAAAFLRDAYPALDWAVTTFGKRNASDLEMLSTLVHLQREASRRGQPLTVDHVVRKVLEIKPHLTGESVKQEILTLTRQGLLTRAAETRR